METFAQNPSGQEKNSILKEILKNPPPELTLKLFYSLVEILREEYRDFDLIVICSTTISEEKPVLKENDSIGSLSNETSTKICFDMGVYSPVLTEEKSEIFTDTNTLMQCLIRFAKVSATGGCNIFADNDLQPVMCHLSDLHDDGEKGEFRYVCSGVRVEFSFPDKKNME